MSHPVTVMDRDHLSPGRSLRWFLLVWESLIYLWGLATLCGLDLALRDQGRLAVRQIPAGAIAAFTAFMLLHTTLLWLGLSGRLPSHALRPHIVMQAALIGAIGVLIPQENVTLGLYRALVVGATGMLTRAPAIVGVASAYLALALLARMWSLQAWHGWATFWNIFWFKSRDATLLLFAVGYLLL